MAIIQNINVSTANDGLGDTLRNSQVKANENFSELNTKKVEVVSGRGLSEENFTTAEKSKLAGLATDAEKNVQANWNQLDDTQDDYIIGKPAIPTGFSEVYEEIFLSSNTNTFTLPVGAVPQFISIDRGVRYKSIDWTVFGNVVTILGDALSDADVYIVGLQS
jgi:hypothetical protein